MAAHHHHHHLPTAFCSPCSFSHGCSCNHNQTHHYCSPPLSSPAPTDPLLQAMASQLIHSDMFSTQETRNLQRLNPRKNLTERQRQQQQQTRFNDVVISSLVSRIEALEASLGHLPPTDRYRHGDDYYYCCSSSSLRDVAARVIQTHFRAFLVRRSRTLRGLKDLALVKSAFNSLKSSFSAETHPFDFSFVSRKAMDLLVKLDCIQGDDPMVRDGKRSISRDLVRFLDFIEGIAMKRHELSLKTRENVRFVPQSEKSRVVLSKKKSNFGGDQREIMGKLRERVEKIRAYTRVSPNEDEDVELEGFQHVSDDDDDEEENPIILVREKNGQTRNGVLVKRLMDQPKVKKSVSFAENKNVLKIFSSSDEPVANEDGSGSSSSDDQGEITENICDEVEEIKAFSLGTEDDDEEAHVVNSKLSSHRSGSIRGHYQGHDGEFVFSAPLPVQMEDKADPMKRRNELKILR